MKQSCTIYSPRETYHSINSIWDNLSYSEPNVEVSENELGGITLQTETGTLELYFDEYREGGDDFSSLILGTRNYFNVIETTHQEIKDNLLRSITKCKAAIGVGAEPPFTEMDERLDIVFGIAEMLDGIIFNNSEMLDKKGSLILDKTGNSELNG